MRYFAIATIALPYVLAAPYRLPGEIFSRQTNTSCNLSETPQPTNTLTPPAAGLELVLIALGHGTQNYTCANASTGTAPASIGAVAQLFNASCEVATNKLDLGSIEESNAAIGAHFFFDNTTPEFDIIGIGETQTKKIAVDSTTPSAADVPWLMLEAQSSGSTSTVRQIYRLNTKGGVAPTTCEGRSAVVTVDYTAQYWVYASSAEVAERRRKRSLVRPVV
ncbi:hypothetical protein P280DRAFT_59367 [Massarina eburnea CBS 473.64]|uniref:Malate dehydrogenase n=1 Tax=Massarina eburnea CBS 473.64 TaxID=1395130 RepID=A0A6A6RUV9_9PLEO|nr:hypothetical protein P280DRAFT_59367 [Massarina eburnea CBS 473.64]